ncbi:MAG: hypothetical protein K2K58_02345, partial [Muribaculaceae bacterium]|nr:hypothetical protein [Muribaculaceae bacterium]
TKVNISRRLENVQGNVWWHGYWVTGNYKGVADSLAMKYQNTIAIPPAYGDASLRPKPVTGLRFEKDGESVVLKWDKVRHSHVEDETDVVKYVVYQFYPGEPVDIVESLPIIAVTPQNGVRVEAEDIEGSTFVVTALDRMNRESQPAKITHK